MTKDRLTDMYYSQLNDMEDDEYIEDNKKIDQNQKVWQALIDILKQDCDLCDYAGQLETAYVCCSHAFEVRAYKMGIALGQSLAGAKA